MEGERGKRETSTHLHADLYGLPGERLPECILGLLDVLHVARQAGLPLPPDSTLLFTVTTVSCLAQDCAECSPENPVSRETP